MSTANLSLEELKKRSTQANEVIDKLKNQIEQIKLASTPAAMADKAKNLQKENETLKKQVEELKKQLEEAEAKKGSKPLANTTNVTANKPKEEKPAKQQENKKAPAKKDETLAPEDINVSKVDIRVGKIVTCKKHPEADLLYVEEIDLGEGKLRNVCSGLVKYIPLEEMQNRLVVLVCNLKPAKLKGVLSEAMVLCASTADKCELVIPPSGAQIGDRVSVAGFEGEPAPECNLKNNIFGIVQPDLKTDDSLVVTYKGVPLEIKGKGPLKSATLKNVPVK